MIDNAMAVNGQLLERPPMPAARAKLRAQGIHPLLASLYSARGVSDIREVRGGLADLLPTESLKNCCEMASILADHIVKRSRVLIVSDYDCDGATAGAVLLAAFDASGMNVDILVPNRRRDGYGLTVSIVSQAAALAQPPDVIVTVDSGISSHEGIELANSLGIEVLVTDHHACPDVLPNARLIVNPNQPGCTFNSKSIAGCGVAWYLARALNEEMLARDYPVAFYPEKLLQFVAIGTIADVVTLDRNNRILVSEGLKQIRAGDCTEGIRALIAVAKRNRCHITCEDIGFAVAPRLNAAGRMADMTTGVMLLLCLRPHVALSLASRLDELNDARKSVEKRMAMEAQVEIEDFQRSIDQSVGAKAMSVCVFGAEWHEGVVGIVASRLKEHYFRPTFVFCEADDGKLKGSGRSIPGLHIKHALDELAKRHPEIIAAYGGHPLAVGVTLQDGQFNAFREAFEVICRERLNSADLQRVQLYDGALPVHQLDLRTVAMLQEEVWGQGFPAPVFLDSVEVVEARSMGAGREHLRITGLASNVECELVAFNQGHLKGVLPDELRILYRPDINRYDGSESLQVIVSHFPGSEGPQEELVNREALKVARAHKIIDDHSIQLGRRARAHAL